ncbi:hypothetical protein Leryth_021212 [Lithospermum erythrorhizon]|nr:hypothetical protein Leryth_021212 [Lithospermum erythrorhizon]
MITSFKKFVNKFCSCLARIESLHKNGVSKEDNIQDARKMYNSIEKQPFRFDHCWDLLKNEQKWLDREATIVSCKRKSTMSRSLPALVSEDATDELMASSNENNNERPIGRKAAKEGKKSGKSLLGDASSLSSAL